MTQRERFSINTLQRDALNTYCIFCNSINEVASIYNLPHTEKTKYFK